VSVVHEGLAHHHERGQQAEGKESLILCFHQPPEATCYWAMEKELVISFGLPVGVGNPKEAQ
jgi:hypothetical protein